ncbi:MAG: iron ABC transporter permease [Deltaproteobacteria bacterium]|nr:iron ABC transporter permease [Myxococcales bacterium]MDP3217542.1 iron ABC transporter permease [Deltaproteobacteria bacterium]
MILRGRALPWVGLAAVLVAAAGALAVGASDVRAVELVRCLEGQGAPGVEAVLSLRWPRVALGVLVGATLATSGAGLQGLLRNTLADPGLVGVSSGAALAVAVAIVLTRGVDTVWLLPAVAFAGAFVTALLVLRVAAQGGALPVASLVLAGVAANALAGAAIGALTFVATDAQLRGLSSWNLGSLGAVTRPMVWAAAPWLVASTAYLLRRADVLDALTLGDEAAAHLGVAVRRERLALVVATAVGVGAATAFVGVLGFVGLVVPHLARGVAGPSHRDHLPVAAALGAVLVVAGDALARTVVAPAELPLGLVTAAFGAPALLVLLRTRAQELVA